MWDLYHSIGRTRDRPRYLPHEPELTGTQTLPAAAGGVKPCHHHDDCTSCSGALESRSGLRSRCGGGRAARLGISESGSLGA
jgi:hypothetical protein